MSENEISRVRSAILCDSDVFAGTERHMVELSGALVRAGVELFLFCPVRSPVAAQSADRGARIVPLQMRGAFDQRAVRELSAFLSDDTVLHAHNGRTLLHAVLAKRWAGRGRVVATQHFLSPSRVGRRGVKRWVSNAMHRWVSARVDRHIAISDAVREQMLQRGDAPAERIDVVHNGMAPPALPDPSMVARVREREGIGPAVRMVFCASRLEAEKDVLTLVRAMTIVRARQPAAVCCIAGEGSMRGEIEGEITRLGLGQGVRLLGYRTDVADLMAAADLFALPCPVEAFGLVLLEAMGAQKAIVATRAGGPVEIVVEGETGLLVAPGDADAMGESIAALLADDARREAMGRTGRRRLETHFTAERMAEQTLAVYRKALAAGWTESTSAGDAKAMTP